MSKSIDELAKRLEQLSDAVIRQEWGDFSMRVPAEPGRDADLVLAFSASLLRSQQQRVAELEGALERMRYEVQRIQAIHHFDSETGLYCDRALSGLCDVLPVSEQRAEMEGRIRELKAENDRLSKLVSASHPWNQ